MPKVEHKTIWKYSPEAQYTESASWSREKKSRRRSGGISASVRTAGRGISIMYPHDSTDNVFNSISDDSHHEDIDEHGLFYHNYDAAIFAWGWPAGSEVTGTR